jgi:murein DD-endopeptidase / murein LD-carboxypeptidase
VLDDFGARIAARAIGNVGLPFRLHGRSAESGFDCVGLLADALRSVGFERPIPADYGLRGQFEQRARAFFETTDFKSVDDDSPTLPGDFAIVAIGPRQLHFIIYTNGGFVHAHAGLRRVVSTPGSVFWLSVGRWRYIGE